MASNNSIKGVTAVLSRNLTFHPTILDQTAVLSNDLRTVTSKVSSWAITSRVLQSHERFSCTLDEWSQILPFCFGVRNTLLYNKNVYHNWVMEVKEDSLSLREIGKPLRDYGSYPHPSQVGYRYSVVHKSNGDLHFEINGMDLGVAFTNVPERVYGYVELFRGTHLTIR